MSSFNIEEIKKNAKEDFEKAWEDTAKLVMQKGRFFDWKETQGKEHPLMMVNENFRKTFLSYGLTEIINTMIIEESEIYRQYGPEAPIILDRLFFLAGLPRADIGVGKREKEQILLISPNFNQFDELQKILREYKKGDIEADNLIEIFVNRLNIDDITATTIIDKAFIELKNLKPVPSKLTLRSHMTASWFGVISNLIHKEELPLKLFSIGPRFRREQRLDASHLYESTSASVVIVSDKVSMEDGFDLTSKILYKLGFPKIKFELKKVTSKYYTIGTEHEVYINFNGKNLEIANVGFYSPIALANYNIPYHVFNIGFGVERMAMILNEVDDIRKLVYGYSYEDLNLSDNDIAKLIEYDKVPKDKIFFEIADAIYKIANENKDLTGPAEVKVFDGVLNCKKIEISLYNWDTGKPLLSRAAFNNLYVYKGSIYGLPINPENIPVEMKEVFSFGIKLNVNYMRSIICFLLSEIESGKKSDFSIEYKMIKRPSEINIKVPETVNRFIKNNKNKIEVKGPLFFGLKAKIL